MALQEDFLCRRTQVTVGSSPFWTPERRPLLQYAELLIAAVERGDAAEVGWLLCSQPANLSDLQPEISHYTLLVAVLFGYYAIAEALQRHQNPDKTPLTLPVCRSANSTYNPDFDAGEEVSFLAMSYGHEFPSRVLSEEDFYTIRTRGRSLFACTVLRHDATFAQVWSGTSFRSASSTAKVDLDSRHGSCGIAASLQL